MPGGAFFLDYMADVCTYRQEEGSKGGSLGWNGQHWDLQAEVYRHVLKYKAELGMAQRGSLASGIFFF